jgi:hypothetical protein
MQYDLVLAKPFFIGGEKGLAVYINSFIFQKISTV